MVGFLVGSFGFSSLADGPASAGAHPGPALLGAAAAVATLRGGFGGAADAPGGRSLRVTEYLDATSRRLTEARPGDAVRGAVPTSLV